MAAEKQSGAKVKVVVRTDAVFHDGAHHPYGSEVQLAEADAKPLLKAGLVEKAGK